jgi:hypothetical protein
MNEIFSNEGEEDQEEPSGKPVIPPFQLEMVNEQPHHLYE